MHVQHVRMNKQEGDQHEFAAGVRSWRGNSQERWTETANQHSRVGELLPHRVRLRTPSTRWMPGTPPSQGSRSARGEVDPHVGTRGAKADRYGEDLKTPPTCSTSRRPRSRPMHRPSLGSASRPRTPRRTRDRAIKRGVRRGRALSAPCASGRHHPRSDVYMASTLADGISGYGSHVFVLTGEPGRELNPRPIDYEPRRFAN